MEPSSLSQIAVIQTPFVLGVEDALSGLAVIDPSSARDRTMTLFQFPHSFSPANLDQFSPVALPLLAL